MGYSMPADEEPARRRRAAAPARAPDGPHEVAIDATSAEEHDIALGSTIKVLFQGPTQEFTVVGTVGFGGEKNLGGTTSAYFDTATAQQVLGTPGHLRRDRRAAPTTASARPSSPSGSTRSCPRAPRRSPARPWPRRTSDAVKEDLKIVGILFMIFAGIALFVGSFIIWNTFTMIVTQRSREIALLRAIGATRRQVLRSLLARGAAARRRRLGGRHRPRASASPRGSTR